MLLTMANFKSQNLCDEGNKILYSQDSRSSLLWLSGSTSCGPASCQLQCETGSQCLQNEGVECLEEPCCPQWSCQTCPKTRPDFGGDCSIMQEGLKCEYGQEECCGEVHPQIRMQCYSQRWKGYHVDACLGGESQSDRAKAEY